MCPDNKAVFLRDERDSRKHAETRVSVEFRSSKRTFSPWLSLSFAGLFLLWRIVVVVTVAHFVGSQLCVIIIVV
jgi:hypothetical protein